MNDSSPQDTDSTPDATSDRTTEASSRRALLRNVALVAGGAAVAGVVTNASPAAAVGTPMLLGSTNAVGVRTSVNYSPPPSGEVGNAFSFEAGNQFDNTFSSFPAAVSAITSVSNNPNGLFALVTSTVTGTAVVASAPGVGSYGVRAFGGKAALFLSPGGTAGPARVDFHAQGEINVDADGNLWCCVDGGTPGTWRKVAGMGTAGAFHALTPGRVYDSRVAPTPLAPLTSGATRTLSVASRRDVSTGAVVQTDFVPAGATAVTANVTIVNTVTSGFLTVNPGGVTTVSASTINWSASGQALANGVTLTLDANRQLTVIAGGGGSTDFIIDISGYYL